MNLKTKQTLSVIFSIGGVIGTIGTVWLARKAAMKEQKMRTPNGCIYPEIMPETTIKDQIKKLLPIYAPTIVVGGLTIGSIVGSTIMSHKAQASIMSMAVLADQGWRRYKHQVKSTLGIDTHHGILTGIAKDELKSNNKIEIDPDDYRELYYDELVGYFKATPADVAFAYAEINEMLNTDYRNQLVDIFDFVTIGTFLKLANAELLDNRVSIDTMNEWGWTMDYLVEAYTWCWIHMNIVKEVTDDGVVPFNVITWKEDPILLDRDQLSLRGFEIEEVDDILDKKYKNQERALEWDAIKKDNDGGSKE